MYTSECSVAVAVQNSKPEPSSQNDTQGITTVSVLELDLEIGVFWIDPNKV